jgi:ATP-binding cassette subfamily F protein 3
MIQSWDGADDKPARRKRKFPYRKAPDIEAEIHDSEQRVADLHAALGQPETLRDGSRVRQIKLELEELHRVIASLYEHWEEAVELN